MAQDILLTPGILFENSEEFTVDSYSPVVISVYTEEGNNIPSGPVISLQRADVNGKFINFSPSLNGTYKLLHNCQQIYLTIPGTYRVSRPNISPWNVKIGVTIEGDAVVPMFERVQTLFSTGGSNSAWYTPNNRTTLFNNAAGTIPVTQSGQTVANMRDISSHNNHAVSSASYGLPESWTDPLTNEVLLWHEDHTHGLTWPIVGAVGTVGIAFTTGAQVFNLTAGETIPHGPIMEVIFIDKILSDAECTLLKKYLDRKVADTSWFGYFNSTMVSEVKQVFNMRHLTPERVIENLKYYNTLDVRLQLSLDDEIPIQWEEIYTPIESEADLFKFIPLSTSRQRFRYVINKRHNLIRKTEWGIFAVTPVTLADNINAFGNSMGGSQVQVSLINIATQGIGSVSWQLRGQPVDRTYMEWVPSNIIAGVPPYHYDPAGTPFSINRDTKRISISGNLPDILNGAMLDYSLSPNLEYVYDVERGITGTYLIPNGNTHPNLSTLWVSGFITPQPFPQFGDNIVYLSITDSPGLTGKSISRDLWNEITYVDVETCGLVGTIPALSPKSLVSYGASRYWRFNNFTEVEPGQILPDLELNGAAFRYNGNDLSQASVDLLLEEAVASSFGVGTDLRLQDNARPSAAGLANREILLARGWTVPITPL